MAIRKVDSYGIDPLRDGMFTAVASVVSYRKHLITADEDQNPQLVAHREFGNVNYYEVILIANGMLHQSEFTAGKTVVIPTEFAAKTSVNRRTASL
jgi:hypothetical protein